MTQAQAAAAIRVARTTLLAIEKGQRRWQPAELQRLAVAYGTSANEVLRRESVHVDLAPRFRKDGRYVDAEAGEAARILVRLVRAEVELENLLGVQRPRNYPAERPLLPGDIRIQAESDALELRQRIGLGLAPVRDIESLLELEFGLRVYVRPLPYSSLRPLRLRHRSRSVRPVEREPPVDQTRPHRGPRTGPPGLRSPRYEHPLPRRPAEVASGILCRRICPHLPDAAENRHREVPRVHVRVLHPDSPSRHLVESHLRRVARGDGPPRRGVEARSVWRMGLVPGQWRHYRQTGGRGSWRACTCRNRYGSIGALHAPPHRRSRCRGASAGASQRGTTGTPPGSRPGSSPSGAGRRSRGGRTKCRHATLSIASPARSLRTPASPST